MSEMMTDPKQELEKLFRKLEKRIDAAAGKVVRLQSERDALAAKLVESERVRREAVGRLDKLIDSIDDLR
jgi:peptidoglycan hydrolase CwlO-like protein